MNVRKLGKEGEGGDRERETVERGRAEGAEGEMETV
jgi:hypothetical protein